MLGIGTLLALYAVTIGLPFVHHIFIDMITVLPMIVSMSKQLNSTVCNVVNYQPDLCNLMCGFKTISSSLRCLSISCLEQKAWSSYSVMILPTISKISLAAAAESILLVFLLTRDFSACSKAMSQS